MEHVKQVININSERALCKACGLNLQEITNFKFTGKTVSHKLYNEEECVCKCGAEFVLHYDVFDAKGHIYSRVFVEDINNTEYHWTDPLSTEQKEVIRGHLTHCEKCRETLDQELLTDAWLKSIMDQIKKSRGHRQ